MCCQGTTWLQPESSQSDFKPWDCSSMGSTVTPWIMLFRIRPTSACRKTIIFTWMWPVRKTNIPKMIFSRSMVVLIWIIPRSIPITGHPTVQCLRRKWTSPSPGWSTSVSRPNFYLCAWGQPWNIFITGSNFTNPTGMVGAGRTWMPWGQPTTKRLPIPTMIIVWWKAVRISRMNRATGSILLFLCPSYHF